MQIEPKQFFVIENEDVDPHTGHVPGYRFVSLYNGARGPWCCAKSTAEEQGREHTRIIKMLHGGES